MREEIFEHMKDIEARVDMKIQEFYDALNTNRNDLGSINMEDVFDFWSIETSHANWYCIEIRRKSLILIDIRQQHSFEKVNIRRLDRQENPIMFDGISAFQEDALRIYLPDMKTSVDSQNFTNYLFKWLLDVM